jgi:hypothetical protein
MKENSDQTETLISCFNEFEKSKSEYDKTKNDLSTTNDHIKKIHTLNKYFVNHKNISSFKLKLIKDMNYMEKKVKLFTIIQFLLGFILLAIPLLAILLFIYKDYSERSQYMFFPYFLSLSLIMGSFMIILVIKLGDSCSNYGIFIVSWERIYLFKIMKIITIGLFILWFLFLCEDFEINFNLLREKVAQSNNRERSSKLFSEGTYSLRLLFILLLWDTEKENGEYNHKKIGYFEYEDSFFKDFHSSLSKLLVPIISACFFYLVKMFFIKTKREFIYFIILLVTLFKCFYFILSTPSDGENSSKKINENIHFNEKEKADEEYFKNNVGKYYEIIPISIIIISLVILNFKRCVIDLIHKKFYPFRHREKNLFIFFVVITSFILNASGYFLFLGLLYILYFKTIDSELTIETYFTYWIIIYISFFLILIGYSYPFGNYCFKLVYYPIAYETYDHYLKNKFYVNSSGNLRKSFNYYQKIEKEKSSQTQSNISF